MSHHVKRFGRRLVTCNARPMVETQAIYYRDKRGSEPADEFITALPAKRAAKIDDYIEEHLNEQPPDAPPPEFRSARRSRASCVS